MNFNSLEYAAFLPIVFALYWALPHKFRGVLLLISSYYFYMSWNPRYVVLILFTTAVSYAAALLLEKYRNRVSRNVILTGTLISCLGVLFFFKYFNFASESVAAVARYFSFSMQPITLKLLLPVGISFYTFQTLSYVIDVYRGEIKAERNFGIYAAFISFFPQLVAGPIERTANLLPQIKSEKNLTMTSPCAAQGRCCGAFLKRSQSRMSLRPMSTLRMIRCTPAPDSTSAPLSCSFRCRYIAISPAIRILPSVRRSCLAST